MNKDYYLKCVFKILFKKGQKKTLNVDSYKELNGVYYYDSDGIIINLGSYEFRNKTNNETDIINKFGKTITHELLHRSIFKITNTTSNDTEERIIEGILDDL